MRYFLLSIILLSSAIAKALAPGSAHDQLGVVNSAVLTPCNSSGMSGATCYGLWVSCPDVAPAPVTLKVFDPKHAIGLVILGTGGLGNSFYESATYGTVTIADLLAAHFRVVEMVFNSGWQVNANGAGLRKAACRYATAANWVKSLFSAYQPVCASGNSAGAAVVGYGLSHYGLDQTLNFVLLSSGPPFSRVDWACDNSQPPTLEYCANVMKGMAVGIDNAQRFLDPAYEPTYQAACSTMQQEHSTALDYMFQPDSIVSRDANLNYKIGVEFMYGAQNTQGTPINQGEYYRRSILSPTLRSCIQDAPHIIPDVLDGAEAIAAELIKHCR
jgi:hypothetical protein